MLRVFIVSQFKATSEKKNGVNHNYNIQRVTLSQKHAKTIKGSFQKAGSARTLGKFVVI